MMADMIREQSEPLDLDDQAEEQARKGRLDRLARDQAREDLQWVMADKRGRRFVARLLDKAHVGRSSFVSANAMTVSFLEGERNVGLALQTEVLDVCPTRFLDMTKEYQENARQLAKRSR
jgi:lambda repressor-like predicted transcriptional regulator